MRFNLVRRKKIYAGCIVAMVLLLTFFAPAQDTENPCVGEAFLPMKAPGPDLTEKMDNGEVFQSRAILTFPEKVSMDKMKDLLEGVKDASGNKLEVDFEPLSQERIYLCRDKNKNQKNVESFLNSLTEVFQEKMGEGSRPSVGPDYVITTDPQIDGSEEAAGIDVHEAIQMPGNIDGGNWGSDRVRGGLPMAATGDGEKIIIAVLDYGIRPLTARNLWKPKCTFKLKIGNGLEAVCDGLTTHGVNFTALKPENICKPDDDDGHGSKVAGIIGIDSGDERGAVGIASGVVEILPIKIFDRGRSGSSSDVIRAIEFIVAINQWMYSAGGANRTRVRIINNSYGFSLSSFRIDGELTAFKSAAKRALQAGLLMVASAGNDGHNISETCKTGFVFRCFPHYPASINLPNVIAVAASNRDDQIIRLSNWGPDTVEMAAPGVEISTIGNDGRSCLFRDTSAAAPLVSGAAALLLSACPGLKSEKVRDYLNNSAVDDTGTLRQKVVEFGRVNVNSAIEKCRQDSQLFMINGSRNFIPWIAF